MSGQGLINATEKGKKSLEDVIIEAGLASGANAIKLLMSVIYECS
jgi:hypothetical protein